MSDSDDTDILLLIPPDFFVNESNFNASIDYNLFESKLQEKTLTTTLGLSQNSGTNRMDPLNSSLRSFHTPHSKCHHQSLEYRRFDRVSPVTQFTSPSAARFTDFPSSTPFGIQKSHSCDDRGIGEVDRHFGSLSLGNRIEPIVSDAIRKMSPSSNFPKSPADNFHRYTSKPTEDDILKSFSSNRMTDWSSGLQKSAEKNERLIDMTAVWAKEENKLNASTSNKVQQESDSQLIIKQLERTVENLQSQLRQCEAKYSDAQKMELSKNDALKHLHAANAR